MSSRDEASSPVCFGFDCVARSTATEDIDILRSGGEERVIASIQVFPPVRFSSFHHIIALDEKELLFV